MFPCSLGKPQEHRGGGPGVAVSRVAVHDLEHVQDGLAGDELLQAAPEAEIGRDLQQRQGPAVVEQDPVLEIAHTPS